MMDDIKQIREKYERYKQEHKAMSEFIDTPLTKKISNIVFNKGNIFKLLFLSAYPKDAETTTTELKKAGFDDETIKHISLLYRSAFKDVAKNNELPIMTDKSFFANIKIDPAVEFNKKAFYDELEQEFLNKLKYSRKI